MLRTSFERMLRECPGAVGGLRPPPAGFGFIDVLEPRHYDAIVYLNRRGVRYLRPDNSPLAGCVRLRFKFGLTTGLIQGLKANDPMPENEWAKVLERSEEYEKWDNAHPTLARRLGRVFGHRGGRTQDSP